MPDYLGSGEHSQLFQVGKIQKDPRVNYYSKIISPPPPPPVVSVGVCLLPLLYPVAPSNMLSLL